MKKSFLSLCLILCTTFCFAKEIDICGVRLGMPKNQVQKILENKGASYEEAYASNQHYFQCYSNTPIYFEGAYVNWFYVAFDEDDCLNAINIHFTMGDSVNTKNVQKCYASLWSKYSEKNYNIPLDEIFDNVFITPDNNIISIFFRNSHFQILITKEDYLAP